MASNREVKFTLIDLLGRQIRAAGGFCLVTVAGAYNKATLFDVNQNALANPIALNQGLVYFQVAKSVLTVDVWIQAPSGHFIIQKGVVPGSLQELVADTNKSNTICSIPWSKVDMTAATETDTGFDLPLDCIVTPDVAVDIATLEAAKTFTAGTLSTESGGVAAGFINAAPLDNARMLPAKSAATATRGSLVGAGTLDTGYSQSLNAAARSISISVSAGTTVAAGILVLPMILSPKRAITAP